MNRPPSSFFSLLRVAILAAAVLIGPRAVMAADNAQPSASAWAKTEQTAVRLIAATAAVGTAETLPLGLEFRLDKGWKIYWRTPGDAGFPPHAKWDGSKNLAGVTIRWPVPERFSVLGLETLGYEDAVVLPLTARLAHPGQPLHLQASVDYLTCKDICIPYTAVLSLDLPAGDATASPFAHLISRFAAQVPGDGATHGVTIRQVAVEGIGKATTLRVEATGMSPFEHPDVFVEGPAELVFGRPTVTLSEQGHRALATLSIQGLSHFKGTLTKTPLTVTLADGPRSAERTLVPQAAPGATAAGDGTGPGRLALIVGLALLGGLILNLMPCVLPVLSIKLLGVISHGGRAGRAVRQSFLASAAGIVFSFLVLAAALIGVKAAGGVIGWGIQFQQTWFLIAMALVVTLFACNLWGFFEIRLPAAFAGFGGDHGDGHGLAGSFLTGAFATLLATPCSAPFLGTAVAFALSRGAPEILMVFAALGIGLALPYLLVAAFPAMATRLPKPGRWMVWLRGVLGFALAVTAGWLLSVLVSTVGPMGASVIGGVLIAIAGILALRARLRGRLRPAAALAVTVLAGAAFVVPGASGGRSTAATAALTHVWQPFDEAAIAGLVKRGHVVFVDVTADWCVTCQVNKTFVLEREAVVKRLTAPGVVAMAADWTRPNADIARYLARFGRYGIPFNAVYGPAAPDGIVLPELLTETAVEDALARAAGAAN